MELQLEEFRRMMEAGRRYLAGQCTIHELNGFAMKCAAAARLFQAHSAIREITVEWVEMIDRCWNEWGHRSDAISEETFRDWLSRQLTE